MVHLCVYCTCILNVIHHWYDLCCDYKESTSMKVVNVLRLNSNQLTTTTLSLLRFLLVNLWLLKLIYNNNINLCTCMICLKHFLKSINELLKLLPDNSHTSWSVTFVPSQSITTKLSIEVKYLILKNELIYTYKNIFYIKYIISKCSFM